MNYTPINPTIIQAVFFDGSNAAQCRAMEVEASTMANETAKIVTQKQIIIAPKGSWICKMPDGMIKRLSTQEFEALYKPLTPPADPIKAEKKVPTKKAPKAVPKVGK